ncbi:MAG: lysine 2,3-aminomutase [Myxococcales bacterium]|nr:lysine 2,3-aminomutase [Myxococcales bacterium]MDH5565553.1 lysine 2,3-aminomutase [Myxococcales bacterium]
MSSSAEDVSVEVEATHGRPQRQVGKARAAEQPFEYPLARAYAEPDWRRIPGYAGVTREQWESAQWQRSHTVKNLAQLEKALGKHLGDALRDDIERDQKERATMSMLIPPHMINTMDERDLRSDPVRRYMAPAFSERDAEWPSHPMASRDSLHEADMWAVEGLTHRYPTKVLAEMIPTCPQYCGHCTRMDLVGNDTSQILKYKFQLKQPSRWQAMLEYLARTPSVRDVVVSGGDVANVPVKRLVEWLFKLMDLPNIRDVRLATKGLAAIPQHFLQDEVLEGYEAIAKRAREREIDIAVHTHVNSAQQVTPLFGKAVRALLDMGYRDVRNQGVLLRGVNTTPNQLLELCFMLMDHAKVTPYYFYLCDMIPNAEHWRLALWEAQDLQMAIMGYLPGFATPRFICDVAFVGKRWVHMESSYDRVKGISYWRKNYRTGIEYDDPDALSREYPAYDPVSTLPEEGKKHWRRFLAENAGKERESV